MGSWLLWYRCGTRRREMRAGEYAARVQLNQMWAASNWHMSRLLRLVPTLVAALLLAGSCLATTPPAKGAHARSKKTKAAEPQPLPPPAPTPEQLPPTPPVVSYAAGQLSILANNSTLAAVLDLVRRQTGASIEMAGVAPSDRVYVKLGPGAPKDVLAALLDGSRFNYAILGDVTDPNAVRRIVLLPKAGATPLGAANPASPQAARAVVAPASDDDDVAPDEPAPAVEEQPQPEPVPNQGDPGQPNQPGQVKTPEQLLQELQQMQQQQQQQQQPPNKPDDPQ
jgi:hypothetical protein